MSSKDICNQKDNLFENEISNNKLENISGGALISTTRNQIDNSTYSTTTESIISPFIVVGDGCTQTVGSVNFSGKEDSTRTGKNTSTSSFLSDFFND